MVSLRQGAKIGSIPWYSYTGTYVCSDPTIGNAFIPQSNGIGEYAHGATSPSATLSVSGYYIDGGCSVDPTTGNLAQVVVTKGRRAKPEVLIYSPGQGTATPYTDKRVQSFRYPAYDDAGNLFVTAFVKGLAHRITELPAGKSAFELVTIPSNDSLVTEIQWVGSELALDLHDDSGNDAIERIKISGGAAMLVGTARLLHAPGWYFWIQGGQVVGLYAKVRRHNDKAVAIWEYPKGGIPSAKYYGMTRWRKDNVYDVTVSR